jgi:Fe2+ transport system protein B
MATATETNDVIVVGRESVGKSELIAHLTNAPARSANFCGSTVACECYASDGCTFVDTPGIVSGGDTEAMRLTFGRLRDGERILLVAQATHLDRDLAELWPLVRGKRGAVAVTFWDKVADREGAAPELARLSRINGVPFVAVNAREVGEREREEIHSALRDAPAFRAAAPRGRLGWSVPAPRTVLERGWAGRVLALLLLMMPAVLAVAAAGRVSGWLEGPVQRLLAAVAPSPQSLAAIPREALLGDYGLFTMGPLLFVWAAPTVVLFALLQGFMKASGLVDHISDALDPLTRGLGLGLGGRDLVRVAMGFGCNVPAVINTRSCSVGSRGQCVSAISFGAACSYQLGTTLAVFAAAGRPGLVLPYLGVLVGSTLVYLRVTAPPVPRGRKNLPVFGGRTFLQRPRLADAWREARTVIRHFFVLAFPVFLAITLAASVMKWAGVLEVLRRALMPAMALFNLPPEAALPVIMACVRKDGIVLFAQPGLAGTLSPLQLLVGVYLSGVLVPCLVTALTISRETSVRFAATLMLRQAAAAVAFSLVLAWGGHALGLLGG